MGDITSGFVQAINLIITLNPEVLQIAALSLYISLSATIFAACISIPAGGFIHFYEFRGKQVLITLIQTLYSRPNGCCRPPDLPDDFEERPAGTPGPPFYPEGMILGQTVLIIPILIGLVIAALGGVDRTIRDTLVSLGATGFQSIIQIVKEGAVRNSQRGSPRFRAGNLRGRCCDDGRGKHTGRDPCSDNGHRTPDRHRGLRVFRRSWYHPSRYSTYHRCHYARHHIGRFRDV